MNVRNTTIATAAVVVLLAIGGYLYLQDPFNPDRTEIEELSDQFMEDIEYKDFHSSAQYHHQLERERVDIGKAIEDLFLVDPELIDIIDYQLVRTRIDSSGDRGRVLVNTRFRPLNRGAISGEDDDIEETEFQLYWMRRHPECPLGTDCDGGICIDNDGQEATREIEVDGDEEDSEVPFDCDDGLDHEWFMNLDSTLEDRDYQ